MRKLLKYNISDIVPYINWAYFYHAWGVIGKSQKESLNVDALKLLNSWDEIYHTWAIFGLFEANSEGDDLIVYPSDEGGVKEDLRIPMLRQQHPCVEGLPNLCLADFIRPTSGHKRDLLGAFCASVDACIKIEYKNDEYSAMMVQVLCDRLAEATVERLHVEVRRSYWGYAPDECLSMEQIHMGDFQGIRPAVGYPSIPDTSVNFILNQLLGMDEIGIRLTESGMMIPHASVSGLMLAHPQARYFTVGKIGEDQLREYAHRRGLPVQVVRKFLQTSLLRK